MRQVALSDTGCQIADDGCQRCQLSIVCLGDVDTEGFVQTNKEIEVIERIDVERLAQVCVWHEVGQIGFGSNLS
jgi:hypothetical protein